MRVSKNNVSQIIPEINIYLPQPSSFHLPERILQFGTGVLLRGLPDYFVDMANKRGLFNGRIVMIKSTDQGDTKAFEAQDNLYTLCIRGVENGEKVEQYLLNNAISRVLTAHGEWDQILHCATQDEMQVVISNTTEVGIQFSEDDINDSPPESFPGKLLAFLYARYQAFQGDPRKGMIIIPTELVTDNGNKLKNILKRLVHKNELPDNFLQWLEHHNTFCNSLVDRIVPGKLPESEIDALEKKLGYRDDLLISAEPYCLWAIETPGERANEILSFSHAGQGVVLTHDISKHRELKLRLLNGTHTFSCALAYLGGFDTVREAMEDDKISRFIQNLMNREIAPAISGDSISLEEAQSFADKILDRFKNPYIVHQWLSIAVQYTSKMSMRNVPLLLAHYQKTTVPPRAMSTGLAAYILFMRSQRQGDGSFRGYYREKSYTIQDDYAPILFDWWKKFPDNPVHAILSDTRLWGADLSGLPGLVDTTEMKLLAWMQNPVTLDR